ncbi:peroxiredoxin [Thiomicrospira sp.]|uniref:peroxiredoxin n=1 Tax=Thiomicrospira sp. TaxID=935 RepID=UPI002F9330DB
MRFIIWFSLSLLPFLAQANNLSLGDTAPDFTLNNQHQETLSLSDYRDHWVVLYFYPKNDTPGCTTEACSFRDNINALLAQQAVVLGVSVDNAESHKSFAEKYNLPFSLLSDPNGEVAADYGALLNLGLVKFAKRHSFIINPDGRIAKIYRDVDPDSHVKNVMADLKRLQAN